MTKSNVKTYNPSKSTIINLSAQRSAHNFLGNLIMTDPRSYKNIAETAGVSVGTVRNMGVGITKSAHARTFQKIGKVYGYRLSLWR